MEQLLQGRVPRLSAKTVTPEQLRRVYNESQLLLVEGAAQAISQYTH